MFKSMKSELRIKKWFLLCALCVLSGSTFAATERDYQNAWRAEHGGETEVVLSDGTRIDIETETHAIEVDFARKWAEAIGQSLHYAEMTGKEPGIVLIVESLSDLKHALKVMRINGNRKLGIQLWFITPDELPKNGGQQ